MRFEKGTIQINRTEDIPLLEEVLRSGFITTDQLFRVLKLRGTEHSRVAFAHRLRRLLRHGLIEKDSQETATQEPVYAISRKGEELAIDAGELFATRKSLGIEGRSPADCLELNELRLALWKSGSLVRWIPATEIRSQNLTSDRYAKEYDAVVQVRIEGSEFSFALEYERSVRPKARYLEIAQALASERRVHVILYAVPNRHVRDLLAEIMAVPDKTICVGLMEELRSESLAAYVAVGGSGRALVAFERVFQLLSKKPPQKELRSGTPSTRWKDLP